MTSHTDVPPELEKAVQTLLKPPHASYLRELHTAIQSNPMYFFNNESTVISRVQQILTDEGVEMKPDEMKLHWQRVLGIAFHRIEPH